LRGAWAKGKNMISYKVMKQEREHCKKLLQEKFKEPIIRDGVLENAIELRNTIWVLDWILESNDND
jgi:hypothetical protein